MILIIKFLHLKPFLTCLPLKACTSCHLQLDTFTKGKIAFHLSLTSYFMANSKEILQRNTGNHFFCFKTNICWNCKHIISFCSEFTLRNSYKYWLYSEYYIKSNNNLISKSVILSIAPTTATPRSCYLIRLYWQEESTAEIWNVGCKQTIWNRSKGCGFESCHILSIFYW